MTTTTTLTTEEQTQLDQMRAQLHSNGYIDTDRHGALRPGARIRHRGHQWPGADLDGTGVLLVLTHKPNSAWTARWGAPDVELIVAWDRPQFGSRLSQLAQYHVRPAINQPADANPGTRRGAEVMIAEPSCDGLCVTAADIGIAGSAVAYPHPGCPLHAPGPTCQCGQPDRCLSPTHGQVTMGEAQRIRHAQRPQLGGGYQECARCRDRVHTLSSGGLCDGCVKEGATR